MIRYYYSKNTENRIVILLKRKNKVTVQLERDFPFRKKKLFVLFLKKKIKNSLVEARSNYLSLNKIIIFG